MEKRRFILATDVAMHLSKCIKAAVDENANNTLALLIDAIDDMSLGEVKHRELGNVIKIKWNC